MSPHGTPRASPLSLRHPPPSGVILTSPFGLGRMPLGLLLMRVVVDHSEVRKGFPFPKTYHRVSLTVQFSFEEKQIIRQRGLGDVKLMDRRPANAKVDARDTKFELKLKHLLNGATDHFLCGTPSAAKIYEDELLRMITQIRAWIADNATPGSRRVVEL